MSIYLQDRAVGRRPVPLVRGRLRQLDTNIAPRPGTRVNFDAVTLIDGVCVRYVTARASAT
jgi:hypothetical protein